MQTVRIIRRQGAAALVEWYTAPEGKPVYHRAVVPADSVIVEGKQVRHPDPDLGIPYGVEWEPLLVGNGVPAATAAVIANELRRMGVWTLADLEADPNGARTAFAVGYGMDVQRLRQAARREQAEGA